MSLPRSSWCLLAAKSQAVELWLHGLREGVRHRGLRRVTGGRPRVQAAEAGTVGPRLAAGRHPEKVGRLCKWELPNTTREGFGKRGLGSVNRDTGGKGAVQDR